MLNETTVRRRGALFRLYVPFISVVVAQALLVLAAPSTAPRRGEIAISRPGVGPSASPSLPTPEADAGSADEVGAGAGSGPAPVEGDSAMRDPGTAAGIGGPIGGASGDTSHCTPDGRQFDVLYHAPPCVPKWPAGADNGGATYGGVTGSEIKIRIVRRGGNPVGEAVLASQGLGVNPTELREWAKAYEEFLNKRYELYGRRVTVDVTVTNCSVGPYDIPCWREAARSAARDAFIVVASGAAVPAEFFEEVARAGVVTVGGFHLAATEFSRFRPFRYDFPIDGTTQAQLVADYYCKKLAGKPATHSGPVIHASIGARGQVERRVAVIGSSDQQLLEAAREARALLAECSASNPPLYTYDFDTARAQEQATAIVAGLVRDKVTTVVPNADGVTLAFLTKAATDQAYYPEWLVNGFTSNDLDTIARLMDPPQWTHAFGISPNMLWRSTSEYDAARVWRDVGRAGTPSEVGLQPESIWQMFSMIGTQLHMAGPELTPARIEEAIVAAQYRRGGWEESQGRSDAVLWTFGPGDYVATADAHEIYWDPGATSSIDGRPGAYRSIDGGRRYQAGQWPSELKVPVPPS